MDLTKVRLDKGEVVETKLPGDKNDPYIPCMIHTDNTVYMMDMNNKSIKCLDVASRTITQSLTLDVTPWRMTLCCDGQTLAITTGLSKTIIFVKDMRVTTRASVKRVYKGVAGLPSQRLVVGCGEDRDGPATIDIIDYRGNVLHTLMTSHTNIPDTEVTLECPRYLHYNDTNNELLVSDYWADSVHRINMSNNEVLPSLTHPQIKDPCQITTDHHGHLAVASWLGQCVLVWSESGGWRTLATGQDHGQGEFVCPLAVCLTDSGHVIIAWYNYGRTVVKIYDN